MIDLSKVNWKQLSTENFAVIIFDILKHKVIDQRGADLSVALPPFKFIIEPYWLGLDVVRPGTIRQGGFIMLYGSPSQAPPEFHKQFAEAAAFLREHGLITDDPTQRSSDYVVLTNKGRRMGYDKADLTFHLPRDSAELKEKYGASIFQITGKNEKGDEVGGTGFLLQSPSAPSKVVIATCDHCIKLEEVTIHVNANTPLPISQFEVTKHPSRDLAVLVPPFLDMAFRQLRSLKLWEGDMPDGSEVLVLGYPTIPQRQPALAMTRGIVMAETFNYRGDADYLTVSSQLSGGSSGSPVLNLCGYVVGVAEEITQEQVQEGIQAQNFGHAIPAKYLRDIL